MLNANQLNCGLVQSLCVLRFVQHSAFRTQRFPYVFRRDHPRRRQKHADEFRFWDLGEQWKNLIGLPFVYALWLVRPEIADPTQIASRLRALRDENLANLDGLIAAENVFDHEFCARYYRKNLRFTFDEKKKEGLQTFAKLCEKDGLLSKHDLVFDLV